MNQSDQEWLGQLRGRSGRNSGKLQIWGAAGCVVAALVFGIWVMLRPPPCHGALTVELRPPLWEEGNYKFELQFEHGSVGCTFEVALGSKAAQVGVSQCPFTRQLRTRSNGAVTSIVGFTLGESPSRLRIKLSRDGVTYIDTDATPSYGESRAESGQFCGRSAWAAPECLSGGPNCLPFVPHCTRSADCRNGETCCVSSVWGKEWGSYAASQCTSRRECDGRISTTTACETDEECAAGQACSESVEGSQFRPALKTCERRTGVANTPAATAKAAAVSTASGAVP